MELEYHLLFRRGNFNDGANMSIFCEPRLQVSQS